MSIRPTALALPCALLTGCCAFNPPAPVVEAPLADVIKHLREELVKARADTPATSLPLTDVTVVLKVSNATVNSGSGGVSVSPVDLKFTSQTTGSLENTITLKWSGSDAAGTLSKKPPQK